MYVHLFIYIYTFTCIDWLLEGICFKKNTLSTKLRSIAQRRAETSTPCSYLSDFHGWSWPRLMLLTSQADQPHTLCRCWLCVCVWCQCCFFHSLKKTCRTHCSIDHNFVLSNHPVVSSIRGRSPWAGCSWSSSQSETTSSGFKPQLKTAPWRWLYFVTWFLLRRLRHVATWYVMIWWYSINVRCFILDMKYTY